MQVQEKKYKDGSYHSMGTVLLEEWNSLTSKTIWNLCEVMKQTLKDDFTGLYRLLAQSKV